MAFNLTKNDGLAEELPPAPKKSKTWIMVVIAGLILACGIWYYLPSASSTATLTSPAPSTSQVVAETQAAKVDPVPKDQNTTFDTPDDLKIPATFAQGSSSLAGTDKTLIKRIVIYLIQNPQATIHVEGYASSDGSMEINQKLSQSRADAFKKYLISQNIEESRIVASGKGTENPVASNADAAGRKKNRRVEITFS